jgi:SDR family mycofactocin-dependent oxidoreductase
MNPAEIVESPRRWQPEMLPLEGGTDSPFCQELAAAAPSARLSAGDPDSVDPHGYPTVADRTQHMIISGALNHEGGHMGRVAGKVALVSGAARGQGRSHAVRLAEEGADIIAFDRCESMSSVPYQLATEEDLNNTVKAVEALDRRIVARKLDVRDTQGLATLVADGVTALGRLDLVAANAGILPMQGFTETSDELWEDVIGTNLTGVFKTVRAALPAILAGGRGGSIVITSSTAGAKGLPNTAPYTAAKHGVIGLTKVIANEYGKDWIRANALLPTAVGTDMIFNQSLYSVMTGGASGATRETAEPAFASLNTLPLPWIEPVDVSNALVWLCSNEARYITGASISVDAGAIQK